MSEDHSADIAAISRIAAVPTILEVVCRTTGMGFAAVARVTEDRWIACSVKDDIAFGLKPGGELKIETTICNEIRSSREPVIIDHVAEDAAFCSHHTPAMYGFQSYISMPIILPNGDFFGTLCAIDPRPAALKNPATIGMFKLFAELIAFHLDAHQRIAASEATLLGEREVSELREQFIAVLGHDLRNPLASVDAGARLLLKRQLDDKSREMIGMMQMSITRMARLIDNVLDLARGRLGGGLLLRRRPEEPLTPVLEHVIAELRSANPDRIFETKLTINAPIASDPIRIGQMLSNLLANAVSHGAEGQPIRVDATTLDGVFTLSVANAGDPIPAATRERLFQPFFRASARPHQEGLGLGLFISNEIARAHGGTLDVSSTADETRFTFRMPLA